MRIHLDYGKNGLDADIPDANLVAVLRSAHPAPMDDPADSAETALRHPIGSQPLAELAHGKTSACIVICDITRPVPNTVLLPPLLRTLEASGIPADRITILIATGTHRPNEGQELIELVGPEIAAKYRCVNHRSGDRTSQRWIGVSPNGVPVWLDDIYCEADIKITVGLIEPHFMAGYSGGRKLIMPGIADFETVQRWHCPRFLESPNATMGVVHDNPVHNEALAIAGMARPDLILDVTLDENNQITGIFAGDMESAWSAGVDFVQRHVRAAAPHPADIVVTTSAGYPLDTTFYQTVKGMVGALPIIKPGGTIIIASECAQGLGSADFSRAVLETEDLEAFVRAISQPDVFVPEEWQVEELARATRQAEIVCVSNLPKSVVERCFVRYAPSVEAAIAEALTRHGNDARLIVIPRGPYIIPFVA